MSEFGGVAGNCLQRVSGLREIALAKLGLHWALLAGAKQKLSSGASTEELRGTKGGCFPDWGRGGGSVKQNPSSGASVETGIQMSSRTQLSREILAPAECWGKALATSKRAKPTGPLAARDRGKPFVAQLAA